LRELLTSPVLTQHNPDVKLLVLTPPPICAYRWGDRDREAGREPQRTAEHTALYAAKAKSVADELKIPCVDLWTGFLFAAGWKPGDPLIGSTKVPKNEKLGELLPDGLHFSGVGNQLCFSLVFDRIREAYPELDPEKMEVKAPWWDGEKDILTILTERFAN
jgi:isoamyl acetate esterase